MFFLAQLEEQQSESFCLRHILDGSEPFG